MLPHKYFDQFTPSKPDNQEAIFLIYIKYFARKFFARACWACSFIKITIKYKDEIPIFKNAK